MLLDRPVWRGRLHTWAFAAAIPAGIALIAVSDRAAARVAASIYAASLLLLFGTSASYHRLAKSPRARQVMQRLDHSMIYVLIAGTYVPICLVVLPRAWGIPMLVMVGVCAATGMVLKLACFGRMQWLSYSLYPIMGWAAIIAAPVLITHLTGLQLGLIIAGGLAYTIGFPVLLVKRPDPWPTVFGYHEVWHLLTVVAAVLHFAAVTNVLACRGFEFEAPDTVRLRASTKGQAVRTIASNRMGKRLPPWQPRRSWSSEHRRAAATTTTRRSDRSRDDRLRRSTPCWRSLSPVDPVVRDLGGQATAQVPFERSSAARSPGPFFSLAAITWSATAVAYSGRWTSRNTPNGVGDTSSVLRRARANASDGSARWASWINTSSGDTSASSTSRS